MKPSVRKAKRRTLAAARASSSAASRLNRRTDEWADGNARPAQMFLLPRRFWLPGIFAVPKAPKRKEYSFVIDYEHNRFLKDGEPFTIIAGTIHYFRVPKELWKDRLLKMKMAGLNTLHAFAEWSGHEPEMGQINFDGNYDLGTFLKTAQDVGLLVILGLGPYIGNERDNGGMPYWLLRNTTAYRTTDERFIAAVEKWLGTLLPMVASFAYDKGGPVIALQVENQYGSHNACDYNYIRHLVKLTKNHLGQNVALFTVDNPTDRDITCGTVEGILPAIALTPGVNVSNGLGVLRKELKKGPLFVGAFDIGKADRWGSPHVLVNGTLITGSLQEILRQNVSVSLRVFHGGTNFGFSGGIYTTSYDYGAPLSESGDPTSLFYGIRRIIEKLVPLSDHKIPEWRQPISLGTVKLKCGPSLKAVLDHFRKKELLKRAAANRPLSFEDLGQDFGFVVYKTHVAFQPSSPALLDGLHVRDRGYIYTSTADYVVDHRISRTLITVRKGDDLEVLVENTGRACDGSNPVASKGLLSPVSLDGVVLDNWTMEALPLTRSQDIAEIMKFLKTSKQGNDCRAPSFFVGRFKLPAGTEPRDTHLDLSGRTKGVAYLNGFNLGRYWPAVGPQVTLYLPGSLLIPAPEENILLLFEAELASRGHSTVRLVDAPKLDGPAPQVDGT